MKKMALILFSLMTMPVAYGASSVQAAHEVYLKGIPEGEGRYILSAEYVNNHFRSGSYACAREGQVIYSKVYQLPKSRLPFHEEHLIKFSICQDETLAHCEEFAVDKYKTFRHLDGLLQNDATKNIVNVSPLVHHFQACEPDAALDEVVKKSIHLNERRLAHVG